MDPSFPGLAGLSIAYALSVTQSLNWTVRMASEVETNTVSVERILEYAGMETEVRWRDRAPQRAPVTGTDAPRGPAPSRTRCRLL